MSTYIKNMNRNEITHINGGCLCFCRSADAKYETTYAGNFSSAKLCERMCSHRKQDMICATPGMDMSEFFPPLKTY